LVGVHIYLFACFDGGADHTERGPITGGGQRAGIAVGQYRAPVGHQGGALPANRAADLDIFFPHALRFLNHPAADLSQRTSTKRSVKTLHALDGPEEIYGRGPRFRQYAADLVELLVEIVFTRV